MGDIEFILTLTLKSSVLLFRRHVKTITDAGRQRIEQTLPERSQPGSDPPAHRSRSSCRSSRQSMSWQRRNEQREARCKHGDVFDRELL
jgi:hypothetical protein